MINSQAIEGFLQYEIDPAFARRARIILENLDVKPGMHLLEVGCGRGFYEKAIATIYSQTSIIGIDLDEKYLTVAKRAVKEKNVKFLKADARNLPFEIGTFDRVICSEVLEHIAEDELVLKEIYRVLKPRGIALITVPNKNYPFFWDPLNWVLENLFHVHVPSHIWWLAGIWADHFRLYTLEQFKYKVIHTGFRVKKIWYATRYCLPFAHFLLYSIGKNIVEMGLTRSFNRFEYKKNNPFLLSVVLKLFGIFDHKNKDRRITAKDPFLNIVAKLVK